MRDRDVLKQALEALKYEYEEGECVIRGWSERERAEIKIPGARYDIGLREREGAFEAVADWWGVTRDERLRQCVRSEQQFVGEVGQQYGYLKALQLLEESGYQLTEQREEQGELVLEAVRYY
jgi:hypothetical protein